MIAFLSIIIFLTSVLFTNEAEFVRCSHPVVPEIIHRRKIRILEQNCSGGATVWFTRTPVPPTHLVLLDAPRLVAMDVEVTPVFEGPSGPCTLNWHELYESTIMTCTILTPFSFTYDDTLMWELPLALAVAYVARQELLFHRMIHECEAPIVRRHVPAQRNWWVKTYFRKQSELPGHFAFVFRNCPVPRHRGHPVNLILESDPPAWCRFPVIN